MRLGKLGGGAAVLALLGWSCTVLQPQPDRTQFFVLHSLRELGAEQATGGGESRFGSTIGIGPVQLPDYLDRPQLVRRKQGDRIEIDESKRWAEPLQSGVSRVVAENLRSLLGAYVVDRYPWSASEKVDYGIRIEISRFEPLGGTAAQLDARWFIRDATSRRVLSSKESTITARSSSPGVDSSVQALSAALADLSREIAAGIRQAR